jgi:hypothetical protein
MYQFSTLIHAFRVLVLSLYSYVVIRPLLLLHCVQLFCYGPSLVWGGCGTESVCVQRPREDWAEGEVIYNIKGNSESKDMAEKFYPRQISSC